MRNLPETVHEYNIPRLNIWFIVSSVFLLLCVFWMVADDYLREWKPYQRQAKLFETQKLLEDHAVMEKKLAEAGFDTVTNHLAQAETSVQQHASQIEELEKKLERIQVDLDVKRNEYATQKALLDQRKSEFDEAVELQKSKDKMEKILQQLRKQKVVVAKLDAEVQVLDERRLAISKEISNFTVAKDQYEKEKNTLISKRELIEKRLVYLKNKILPAVVDQPLIEFAQPTVRIKQMIAEDQKYSLNFVEVPRIDRCITCHTFTERKDSVAEGEEGFRFANLPQPWKSHSRLDLFVASDSAHPMERFGCSVCHEGWDRSTAFIRAAHTPAFYAVKEDYVRLPLVEGIPHWLPTTVVEKWRPGLLAKVQEHAKLVEERESLKSSRHRNPKRLQEVRAAIQAARAELKEQYGMTLEALSQFQFASYSQEQAWEQPPLNWHPMEHKEDPMRPREFIESSCLKCHQNVTDIPVKKDPAGTSEFNPGDKINAGLHLIEQAGCYACHKIQALETVVKRVIKPGENLEALSHAFVAEPQAILNANNLASAAEIKPGRELMIPVRVPYPKPGPSLLKIASKTSKEWMIKWLEDPKAFRSNTLMPQFWNLDNNRHGTYFDAWLPGQDKPIKIDWADRNAVEMASVAEYLFKVSEKPIYPAPPKGDPSRGEKLVNSVGCLGCHVVDQKLGDIIFRDRRSRSQGPMLFGAGSKYDAGWLYAWLKNPNQYRHDTRMPNLCLSGQEAADITAYLMANHNTPFEGRKLPEVKSDVLKDTAIDYLKNTMSRNQAVTKVNEMDDQQKLAYIGKKLVQRYGCISCHNIKGFENAKPISIDLSDWASKSPTKLDFGFIEIPHDNHAYLHQKLQAPRSFDRVETKAPQEMLRMPQFNFTEEQIELIMTAVMGMTGENPDAKVRRNLTENEWTIENGRWLMKELNCMGCHVNEDQGGAIRRTMDEDKTYLFPPSLTGVGTKVRPAWLHDFLKNPGKDTYRYWLQVRMPTFTLTDDQLNALTQYFALRDKQPYPYESDATETLPPSSKEMVEAGAKIVEQFKCLSCHAPRSLEQAMADPSTAVNFSVVKHRMRPKGVIEWLKNPGAITPGVNMPAFWPEGQPSPLPDILGGDLAKQIQAVADYLRVYNTSAPPVKTIQKKETGSQQP